MRWGQKNNQMTCTTYASLISALLLPHLSRLSSQRFLKGRCCVGIRKRDRLPALTHTHMPVPILTADFSSPGSEVLVKQATHKKRHISCSAFS